MLKKIYSLSIILLTFLLFVGCHFQADPEEIAQWERYNEIQNVRNKYKFYDEDLRKAFKDIYISPEKLEDYLLIDLKNDVVKLNVSKIIDKNNYFGKALETIRWYHFEYHTDICLNEKEWDLWMDTQISPNYTNRDGMYIKKLDERGRYVKNFNCPTVRIYNSQKCPMCIYKFKNYLDTGKYTEAENWQQLYLFNASAYGKFAEENNFLVYTGFNYLVNNYKKSDQYKDGRLKYTLKKYSPNDFGRLLRNDWDSFDIKDKKAFKKKWDGKEILVTGNVEEIKVEYDVLTKRETGYYTVEFVYGGWRKFRLSPSDIEKYKIKPGDYITIYGKVEIDTIMGVDYKLYNCRIIK